MAETMSFQIKDILPQNTQSKTSQDPVGNDIVKITEEFTKLLIAQIQNQDPENTQDITQTITQYSQMLATQGNIKVNNAVTQFGQVNIASNMIGKVIDYNEGYVKEIAINPATGKEIYINKLTLQEIDSDQVPPGVSDEYKPKETGRFILKFGTGTVKNIDFTTDTPRVQLENDQYINVSAISAIHDGQKANSLQTGAQIVGKTVSYTTMIPNTDTSPGADPFIPGLATGIVTEITYTSVQKDGNGNLIGTSPLSIPLLTVSGDTNPISISNVVQIHN